SLRGSGTYRVASQTPRDRTPVSHSGLPYHSRRRLEAAGPAPLPGGRPHHNPRVKRLEPLRGFGQRDLLSGIYIERGRALSRRTIGKPVAIQTVGVRMLIRRGVYRSRTASPCDSLWSLSVRPKASQPIS